MDVVVCMAVVCVHESSLCARLLFVCMAEVYALQKLLLLKVHCDSLIKGILGSLY